jgi:hypothetical protein
LILILAVILLARQWPAGFEEAICVNHHNWNFLPLGLMPGGGDYISSKF